MKKYWNDYVDTEFKIIVSAAFWPESEEESFPFFEARWGPHGCCQPGNWMGTDAGGFSIAVPPQEFETRFRRATEDDYIKYKG